MKKPIKKWALRLTATALFIVTLLLVIVLNPVLTYANKTAHNNYTVFHNTAIDSSLIIRLDEATELLKASEFYDQQLKLDICLNDGSKYSALIQALRGQAFAWGFYDKVVLQGTANFKDNYIELNGYRWNLTQLLAHEITHCMQFNKLGFLQSNPVASIPRWKWEGYAEYVSRQNNNQKDLSKNIVHFISTDKNNWAINFEDSTIAPRDYYDYWTLVQFCIDIKKQHYQQILADTTSEQSIRQQMMDWYNKAK